MCLKYWPATKFQFHMIEVEILETKTYAHFVSFILFWTILLFWFNFKVYSYAKKYSARDGFF